MLSIEGKFIGSKRRKHLQRAGKQCRQTSLKRGKDPTNEKGGKYNTERKRKPVHVYYPCKTVIWWVARVLGQLQAR